MLLKMASLENKDFLEAVKKAYFQNVKRFNINGFRKGKAPKNIIEKRVVMFVALQS